MKQVIRVRQGGREGVYFDGVEQCPVTPDCPRCWREPWIELVRDTFEDGNPIPIKSELAIFGYDRDEFIIRWKELKKGANFTDLASLSSFLIWEK